MRVQVEVLLRRRAIWVKQLPGLRHWCRRRSHRRCWSRLRHRHRWRCWRRYRRCCRCHWRRCCRCRWHRCRCHWWRCCWRRCCWCLCRRRRCRRRRYRWHCPVTAFLFVICCPVILSGSGVRWRKRRGLLRRRLRCRGRLHGLRRHQVGCGRGRRRRWRRRGQGGAGGRRCPGHTSPVAYFCFERMKRNIAVVARLPIQRVPLVWLAMLLAQEPPFVVPPCMEDLLHALVDEHVLSPITRSRAHLVKVVEATLVTRYPIQHGIFGEDFQGPVHAVPAIVQVNSLGLVRHMVGQHAPQLRREKHAVRIDLYRPSMILEHAVGANLLPHSQEDL
mmetsp:Transcript_18596/g.49455  ORF Transcript_18596/g.49455 Transcript_18596/m.49455 type:complete len:332 (-) Transcript_18596:489-1484(-)